MHPLLSLSAAALLISPTLFLSECGEPPGEASCDRVIVSITPLGELSVTNENALPVVADVEVYAYTCASQGCTATGTYPGETLAPGETRVYTADTPPEFCSDIYCCDTGYVARGTAIVTLPELGCGLEARAEDSSTCSLDF